MNEILDKMIKAEVIVFAIPVYFYSMSAQLKLLVDRTIPKYLQLVDKEIYIFATAADRHEHHILSTIEAIIGYRRDSLIFKVSFH